MSKEVRNVVHVSGEAAKYASKPTNTFVACARPRRLTDRGAL